MCTLYKIYFTSFKERIFINDKRTRILLKRFAAKGLSPVDFRELTAGISAYAPCLQCLLATCSISDGSIVKCLNTFSSLLLALASDSAACALIHSSEQAKLIVDALLSDENIVHSPTTMSIL